MGRLSTGLAILICILITSTIFSQTQLETVFGPKLYKRSNGSKNEYVDKFTINEIPIGTCKLTLQNGEQNRQFRISSGVVKLNGREIIHQSDLNQNVFLIERDVTLQKNNTLEVTLSSKPGSYIRIGIISDAVIIKDTTAPYLYVESPSNGLLTNQNSIVVTGVSRDDSPFEVKINSNNVETLPDGSFSMLVSLQEGSNQIIVSSEDSSGNSSRVTRNVYSDTTPPEFLVTNPNEGLLTNITMLNIEGSATDINLSEVKINGNNVNLSQTGTFSYSLQLLDGINPITMEAIDKAGNRTTISRNVTLDMNSPKLIVDSPVEGLLTNKTTWNVSGSVTDSNLVILKINGKEVSLAADGSFTVPVDLIDGQNKIEFEASDGASNKTTLTRSVQVDTTRPVITIKSPENGYKTKQDGIDITGVITELNEVEFKINGNVIGLNANKEFTYTTVLNEGKNLFEFTTLDKAGNSSTSTLAVILDTKNPEITFINPGEELVTKNQFLSVEGTVKDLTKAKIKVNEVECEVSSDGKFSKEINLTEGINTIVVTAEDEVGNNSSLSRTVRLDTQSPIIILENPIEGTYTNKDSILVKGKVIDSSKVILKINNYDVEVLGISFMAYIHLTEGVNTITVSAEDEAENTSSLQRGITVDYAPPILIVDKPLNRTFTNQTAIEVSGNSNDNVRINEIPVVRDSSGNFTLLVNLTEGENKINVISSDIAGNSITEKRTVILDTIPPVISIISPQEKALTNNNILKLEGTVDEKNLSSLLVNGTTIEGASTSFMKLITLTEGKNIITITAIDSADNSSEVKREVKLDTKAPVLTVTNPFDGKKTTLNIVEVKGTAVDSSGVIVKINGTELSTLKEDIGIIRFNHQVSLTAGLNTILVEAIDSAGNSTAVNRFVTNEPIIIPPDPAQAAPKIDPAIPEPMYDKVNFLFTGDNPVQMGVDSASIKSERISVIRGEVKTREDDELPGVKVSVADHPEYGYTFTRNDGMFDLAINGGGWVDVVFEKEGMLPAYRKIDSDWNEYIYADSLAMVPLDNTVTTITFADTIQTAKSSVVTDEDGSRQAVLLFDKNTEAEMVMPDNSVVKLPSIDVRITEYTVGPNGPMAMPAELPSTSGYTYCAELTADEAIAAGAKEVKFNKPVIYYVDNFIDFPVGMPVPVGYWDMGKMVWVPLEDGLVIGIAGETNGLADLIIDKSGTPAVQSKLDSMGIDNDERKKIADLYEPGQSIMRTPINYFGMYDKNCGIMPPEGAEEPEFIEPEKFSYEESYPNLEVRTPVNIQNQAVSKEVGLNGTPFDLHYESDRVLGRKNEISIPITNDSIPKGLKKVILEVDVEGNKFRKEFQPVPNQNYDYTWNGKDGYDRVTAGAHNAKIKIGYVYNAEYQYPSYMQNALQRSFGKTTGLPIPKIKARSEVTLWKESGEDLVLVDNRNCGIGGWNLDVQHNLDPVSNTLYLGSGQEQAIGTLGRDLGTVAGIKAGYGSYPDNVPAVNADIRYITNIDICPDKTILICENDRGRVLKVGRDGIIRAFAGAHYGGQPGDGIPAAQAALNGAYNAKYAPDGSVYILERYKLRKVDKTGKIWTIAGTGEPGFSGDGGPAINAKISLPHGLALSSDGNIYISDQTYYPYIGDPSRPFSSGVIRKISPDGIISTVVGGGDTVLTNTEIVPPTKLIFDNINDLDIGPDGNLYFVVDEGPSGRYVQSMSVFKLCNDGKVRRVAGRGGVSPFNGDGIPAADASLVNPFGLEFGPDGKLYIADYGHNRIRTVNNEGKIETVVGNGNYGYPVVDGLPPLESSIIVKDIAFGPDGTLYFCNGDVRGWGSIVRQVSKGVPVKSPEGYMVPANNGKELYYFDNKGKHLRTEDALTGKVLFRFSYDGKGFLISVTDRDSLISTIERDTLGNPTAIVSPYGERTGLSVDSLGYLASVTNPKGETIEMRYGNEGLLTGLISPKNNTQGYSYDDAGRLTGTLNPEGGSAQVTKSMTNNGYTVQTVTLMEQRSTVTTENLPNDAQRITVTDGTGLKYTRYVYPTGQDTLWTPDGTVTASERAYDPRFGLQVPINAKTVVKTPAGLISTQNQYRKVTQMVGQNATGISDSIVINGKASVSRYDGINRLATQVSPEGRKSFTFYNTKDQVIKDSIPGLAATTYQYDPAGNIIKTTQAGRSIIYTYDEKGRVKTTTDPLGRVTENFYDDAGRLIKQSSDSWHEVNYTYDDNGNLTSITPPGRDAHIFTYNKNDAAVGYTPPMLPDSISTVTNYNYNLDGQLAETIYPDSSFVEVIYDTTGGAQSNGRPKQVVYDQGVVTYDYNYVTGNIKSLSSLNGYSESYTYDGSLPLTKVITGEIPGNISVKYNNDFRVTEDKINNSFPISYLYDKDGALLQAGELKLKNSPINGMLLADTLGSIVSTYEYNQLGESTKNTARFGGNVIYDVELKRDSLSRIVEKTETFSGITNKYSYKYDRSGKLVETQRNDTIVSRYGYDLNGNRTYAEIRCDSSLRVDSAYYDVQDRLVKYGNVNYFYNRRGDITRKVEVNDTTNYTYDNFGNLITVILPDKSRIDYVIDASNRRIGKKVNGRLVIRWIYSGGLTPVAELDSLNRIVTRFAPGYIIKHNYTLGVDSLYRIVTDDLGSIRLIVNTQTGTVTQKIEYDEYGNELLNTNQGFQPLGYASGLYDSQTKLVRFGARDYDAKIGRWTSKDPIGFEGGDGNLYAYCGNDPVNNTDLQGTFITREIQTLQAVGSMVLTDVAVGRMLYKAYEKEIVGAMDAANRLAEDFLEDVDRRNNSNKTYVTYCLSNKDGDIYYGRASGYGDPYTVMMHRYYGHIMRYFGYEDPQLDEYAMENEARSDAYGTYIGKQAIRGREQQLIDMHITSFGIEHLGNSIRGVAKNNPNGYTYWLASNAFFGNIAPYTGY